jgi:hypothetical protein
MKNHPIDNHYNKKFFRLQSLQVSTDVEREELKNALVATQESAAIQILLEAVLGLGQPTSGEQVGSCH